jgi:uncharacterized 2Fe-2S/4Fe-4S cluster protein (DUF4445 family)
MPKVTFIPDDVTVSVSEGENLLRAAMMADVGVTASCGGDGTCGKCRLVVEQGSVDALPSTRITPEQADAGVVLGCLATVTGDVTVAVPPESRPGIRAQSRSHRANAVLPADTQAARIPSVAFRPPVMKRAVTVEPPDLTNNVSDLSRVRQGLRRVYGLDSVDAGLEATRALPSALRGGNWTVTATLREAGPGSPVISGFESRDFSGRALAAAVDVGTTSVEIELLDLVSGEILASAGDWNAQVSRGEDVITRVIVGSTPTGLTGLQGLVASTIEGLVERCCVGIEREPADIATYLFAGNTVMTHLLFGISPASIRTSPYTTATSSFPWVRATDIGLPGSPSTMAFGLPCPASWLGGDIVAGVLASGMAWTDKLTLFVDVGTNGEIVLGNKDFLVACSCSAGPAFEGGGIRHGMRASDGAVEQVRIADDTLEPALLTVGGVKPLGICGSGLIDVVSELFLCGAIDRSGRFAEDMRSPRVRHTETGGEYVLAYAEASGTGRDIVLTSTDIENLMRAKAAIYAGVQVLAESLDIAISDIEEVIVAGGFGRYLDLERVTALGMFPELPKDRFVFIGNSSLSGARLVATSSEMLDTAARIAESIAYLELSVNGGFMDAYTSSLFLPHTDLAAFPVAEALRADRSAETGGS